MGKLWELKQAATPKTLDLYIYSDIEGDQCGWFGETIESNTSANHFRKELEAAGAIEKINIYINSLGGSVIEGTAIYNQLKRNSAYKTVYIDGFAASVASVIAMAGNKIIMPKNSNMMIHNMWIVAAGNAKELRKVADDLDILMQSNRQAYLLKSGEKLTEEKLIELLDAETWLTADQAIELGLADEIAENEVDIEQAKQTLEQAKQSIKHISINTLAAKAEIPEEKPTEPEKQPEPIEPIEHEEPKEEKPIAEIAEKLEKVLNAFTNNFIKN